MTDQQLRERFVKLAPKEWKARLPASGQVGFSIDYENGDRHRIDYSSPENAHAALAMLKWLGSSYEISFQNGFWQVIRTSPWTPIVAPPRTLGRSYPSRDRQTGGNEVMTTNETEPEALEVRWCHEVFSVRESDGRKWLYDSGGDDVFEILDHWNAEDIRRALWINLHAFEAGKRVGAGTVALGIKKLLEIE